MTATLERELAAGLPHLRGTDITGRIPIPQSLVADLVAQHTKAVTVEIRPGNILAVRVLGVSVALEILRVEPPLRLVVSLPFALRLLLLPLQSRLPPFLAIQHGSLVFDAAELARRTPYWPVLQHLQLTGVQTVSGRLLLAFRFQVSPS